MRAKLPSTQGIWPAHWMLPTSGGWPPEIDIMELLGHEPTRVYMTHHWGTWPNVQSDGGSFAGPDFSQDLHTFAIEWAASYIIEDDAFTVLEGPGELVRFTNYPTAEIIAAERRIIREGEPR